MYTCVYMHTYIPLERVGRLLQILLEYRVSTRDRLRILFMLGHFTSFLILLIYIINPCILVLHPVSTHTTLVKRYLHFIQKAYYYNCIIMLVLTVVEVTVSFIICNINIYCYSIQFITSSHPSQLPDKFYSNEFAKEFHFLPYNYKVIIF